MGNAEERNGTLMCTDAYAATFGIKSHGTVSRCLNLLKERGLIVCTRKGVKLRSAHCGPRHGGRSITAKARRSIVPKIRHTLT
jgi:hypothetical protein